MQEKSVLSHKATKARQMKDDFLAVRKLTVREREIVDCLALGFTNKQIAEKLEISNQTVKNHLVIIFVKLNVKTRMQAALSNRGVVTTSSRMGDQTEHIILAGNNLAKPPNHYD